MRSWFPLADYDFWGYLAGGGLLLGAVLYAAGVPLNKETFSDPVSLAAALGAAYTLGHANATLSSWLVESRLVGRVIGWPTSVMLGAGPPRPALLRRLFRSYYAPLPAFTIQRINDRLGAQSTPTGEEVFQRAYHYSRPLADVRERMDAFRNQYGFCRNAITALLISGTLVAVATPEPWTVALTAALAAGLLFLRYLKFLRLYAAEALGTLAYREKAS